MIPSENSKNASGPANGRSASAACSAVPICVMPWACKVAPVVTMMKKPIRLE